MMIDGIEEHYERIADAIQEAISEPWAAAKIEAIFYPHSIDCRGEYCRDVDGVLRSFPVEYLTFEAFIELRERFREAGKPLWGRATFELWPNGKFKMNWDYDDCDENGFAHYDPDKWLAEQEERQHRLTRPALKQP